MFARNHPEDYPEYVKGGDIISFDIYPAASSEPEIAGKIEYVAKGVSRLIKLAEPGQVVWNFIECTRIHNPKSKATPQQVRAEVWMSIIHGSMGIIYFVHEWEPKFNESALLSDPEMLSEVSSINHHIAELAPVLNTPTLNNIALLSSDGSIAPVAYMVKQYKDDTYIFTIAMDGSITNATVVVAGLEGEQTVEVLFENRTLLSKNGVFVDSFSNWDVHIYRIGSKS